MLLSQVTTGGQVLIAEVPIVTALVGAVIGWMVRRLMQNHNARVDSIAADVREVKHVQQEQSTALALLIAGDVEDDAEQKRTRERLHKLENAAAFLRARLELRGAIHPGEWERTQSEPEDG